MPFDASPALTTEALDAIALLTKARAFLNERDWVRRSFYLRKRATPSEISAVCAEGAVCLAQYGEPNFDNASMSQMINSLAYRAMQQVVHVGNGRISLWNDKAARDKDDVLTAFDDAANLLRSGWLPS